MEGPSINDFIIPDRLFKEIVLILRSVIFETTIITDLLDLDLTTVLTFANNKEATLTTKETIHVQSATKVVARIVK